MPRTLLQLTFAYGRTPADDPNLVRCVLDNAGCWVYHIAPPTQDAPFTIRQQEQAGATVVALGEVPDPDPVPVPEWPVGTDWMVAANALAARYGDRWGDVCTAQELADWMTVRYSSVRPARLQPDQPECLYEAWFNWNYRVMRGRSHDEERLREALNLIRRRLGLFPVDRQGWPIIPELSREVV